MAEETLVAQNNPAQGTGKLTLLVVTPEATALSTTADFVALPLYDGELGVAPLHSPFIGRLGYGELRIKRGATVERLFIDGGFVQCANDVVSVLTGRAIPAVDLNPATAQQHLDAARARVAHTEEALALKEKAEKQARAQLRVAERARDASR